jgi:hypothetical protein
MRTFKIELCKSSYGYRTIFVEAESNLKAQLKALDDAGDYEFSESSSEYTIDDIQEVKND